MDPSVAAFADMGYTPVQAALGVAFSREHKLGESEVWRECACLRLWGEGGGLQEQHVLAALRQF
jgi:hypothetical protein